MRVKLQVAKEELTFAATKEELIQLVKFWRTEALDLHYLMFSTQAAGMDWIRRIQCAETRIDAIAAHLDDAVTRQAIRKADREFRKSIGPRAWRIWQHGTRKEQAAFQQEVARRERRQHGAA